MIRLIQVNNPLQPSVDRESRELEYCAEARLANYLPEGGEYLSISLNGRMVEQSLLGEITPRDGDCIVTVPKIAGGGLLRTLAEVGVIAASIVASVATAGALAGPAGAWASATTTALLSGLAAGAVGIAGNLLISAFMNSPSKKSDSPTYAFDGPHSLAHSGTVIPKGYGKFRWGGNIISSFIDVEGKNQYINCLVCFGFGPARSITDIQINGKPISEYGNVAYFTRLGTNDQVPIGNFNRIVNGYPQNAQCLAGVPVIVPGTGTLTQILQVDIVFPSGVWVLTDHNNLIPAELNYLVEYALNGSSAQFSGSTTAGSNIIALSAPDLSIPVGTTITGPGIPAGTTKVDGAYVLPWGGVTLSNAATTSASGSRIFTAVGIPDWLPVVTPRDTADVTRYHLDGTAYIPHAWYAVATDLPPHSGVVYALDDGPHYPGEPWSGTETVQVIVPDGSSYSYAKTFYGEWQRTDPLQNNVQVLTWRAGYVSSTFANQSPVYQRTSIYGLPPGKYDVRVTKYGSARWGDSVVYGDNWSPQIGQDMWIHSVNEIALLDLAYPNMILIGVRALATGQIGGADINITATIQHGLRTLDNNILPGALQLFEEDNPACVAADMMLDGLYGGGQFPGIAAKNIDRFIDEWVAWAQLNDELVDDGNGGSIRRHVFNGVFDNEGNLWDQLNAVGRMSRAQLIPMGRDYGVFLDQADVPCQIFSVGNIVQDSFNETWIELDARANQVEIQFADATRFYKQDNPLAYMDPSNQDAGVAVKNVRIDGKGITIPAQAWHLARFKERCNQFLLRSGSFKCDVDAIASRPGNVVILQHDVPQWGWGGRTLPGSTASKVYLDRDDIPFETGTSYNLIVLFPALQRYSGTVSAAAPVVDSTGATTGMQLTLSSFDNANRVTRAVMVAAGIQYDCPITSSGVGYVIVQPIAGYSAAPSQAYTLYDTDVMEIATVTGISAVDGALILGTPFSQAPEDYSTYFYGPVGTQKLVRITNIRKASEFRATVEWIDYDARCYIDGTPIIGETSAQRSSKPGVTNLKGGEVLSRVGGSYISSASLSWTNGPDTVGVGIYATYLNAAPVTISASTTAASATIAVADTSGMASGNRVFGAGIPAGATILSVVSGTTLTLTGVASSTASGVTLIVEVGTQAAVPQMVARLTNHATSWQAQVVPGTIIHYTVVGFDINNSYAGFKSAPYVIVEIEGFTTNLLLGSSFATGFTYWNVRPRTGDTLVPDLLNDGEATYTVVGSTLTTPQVLLFQPIPQSKWAIGDYLMLSAYFEDSAVSTANVGSLQASIAFLDSSGTLISKVSATAAMSGTVPLLNRFKTASTQVPLLTASVVVLIEVAGGSLSIPVGSVLTFSHLLLEKSTPAQSLPSFWADIDVQGAVLDYFTTGSSTGLRVQGSVVPTFTGSFNITATRTNLYVNWGGLAILWPDRGITYVADNGGLYTALTCVALTASTTYWAYLYWDVIKARVCSAVPTTVVGSGFPPGSMFFDLNLYLSAAYDPIADAFCKQDGRVPLTPGGMQLTTPSSGTTTAPRGGPLPAIGPQY